MFVEYMKWQNFNLEFSLVIHNHNSNVTGVFYLLTYRRNSSFLLRCVVIYGGDLYGLINSAAVAFSIKLFEMETTQYQYAVDIIHNDAVFLFTNVPKLSLELPKHYLFSTILFRCYTVFHVKIGTVFSPNIMRDMVLMNSFIQLTNMC